MPSFGRVLTAMATPLHDDGSLDLDGVQRLAAHLVDTGSDGLVVLGTTGESPTMTHAETLDTFRAVVEAVGERATVLAGCGKNDTAATATLVAEATGLGVDGILLVTPAYNRPSQRGLIEHFTVACRATELPVLLYDIPSRTAVEIAPETMLRLATEIPNVRGVKDAVGNVGKTAWMAARVPETFEIYGGDDANLLPMLAVGAVGVVSVAAHFVGAELATMIDVFGSDPAKAREIAFRLQPLFAALFVDSNPVPLKAGLALAGLPAGPCRLPLTAASNETKAAMRAALEQVGVALVGA